MKAAQLVKYGDKDAIEVRDEVAKPVPKENQVLVEVEAAGINPFDVKVRDGLVRQMADLKLPATLGGDVAGTIVELGEGVKDFQVGQAVYGQANALGGNGSFAEFTPVKTTQLTAQPNTIDAITAAALPLVGTSAYQALVDHIHLQPAQKILIHGGAGGIGSIAIQIAKHLGAHVATTATAEDSDFVKDLGADEVIDYKSQDFSQLLKDYDAVFDMVGGETTEKSYQVLKPGGSLVSMVSQPDEELVKKHGITFVSQFTKATTERLTKLADLVEAGKVKAQVDKVFPLDQAAEAMEYLKTGHPHGKVVIQVK